MRSPAESSMSSSRRCGIRRDLLRHREQVVGRVAHRGDDDDDVVPLRARSHHALGHTPELVDVRDAAAAVFLDDDRHGLSIARPEQSSSAEPRGYAERGCRRGIN